MMSPLDLDEHPTRAVRDHVVALAGLVLFCAVVLLMGR
ncbi:hypothetical protein JNB_06324 [Janibacter sp. HTCC2649]|nr:hypothetical protein JNB_06324 [Janibacter sp. HTCC2649]